MDTECQQMATCSDQEDRQLPVLDRFRIRQTDLFCEKRKKNRSENYILFGEVSVRIKILQIIRNGDKFA